MTEKSFLSESWRINAVIFTLCRYWKAAAGILITLEKPTKPMLLEAKQAGQFKGEFATFDKLQIVTVQDILDNKRMNLPLYSEVVKEAKTDSGAKQLGLFNQ